MANQTCNPSILNQVLGITATGPRTVIVPADPIIWDAETSYEYLTLVASTDFGQAYISKRDVPAGTLLTNTEYWIPAASYNAQLAQLQKGMSALQGDMSNLETDLGGKAPTNHASADITYGVATAANYGHVKLTDVAGSGTASDGMATTPTAVSAMIAAKSGTNMVVIGDSYSSDDFVASTGSWWSKVAKALGLTAHNYAVAGAGYTAGTTFSTQLDNASDDSSFGNDTVAAVFMFGYLNDAGSMASESDWNAWLAAVVNAINKARTEFPHAVVYVVGPNTWQSMTTNKTWGASSGYPSTYFASVKFANICATNGAVYINTMYACYGLARLFGTNGHPSAEGQSAIAATVLQAFGFNTSLYPYNLIGRVNCEAIEETVNTCDCYIFHGNGYNILNLIFNITDTGQSFTFKMPYNFQAYIPDAGMVSVNSSNQIAYVTTQTQYTGMAVTCNASQNGEYFISIVCSG